ncbi:hypothetical protein FPV67DRAFT_419262 [Lyophyllum atratum]|nr:hypothetical protein FPV67DRAFT_419262 [Lyophyllum atratum]
MNAASTSAVVPGNWRAPSHDPLSLRSRVVEILAGTANGCLTELGYYPGMPQRLQELERENVQWQSENLKLFQDNRSLTLALQEQDGSKYKNTIHALEGQVQGLLQEKARLVKQHETLLAGQPIAYQRLLVDYQMLHDYYKAALQEINRLRVYREVVDSRAPAQHPLANQPTGQEAIRSSSISSAGQNPKVPQSLQSQITLPILPMASCWIVHGRWYANRAQPTSIREGR